MELDIRKELFQLVLDYAREKHSADIEKAYEYFFEEEAIDEYMGGRPLELAFINFEDWLICSFRDKDGKSYIDLFMQDTEGLEDEAIAALCAMRDSTIGLYEVIASGDAVRLKDLLMDEEVTATDAMLRSLEPGNVFAARLIEFNGERVMSRCVYPFGNSFKSELLEHINTMFARYVKHKNPGASMAQFLRDESYVFNTIWINNIYRARKNKDAAKDD